MKHEDDKTEKMIYDEDKAHNDTEKETGKNDEEIFNDDREYLKWGKWVPREKYNIITKNPMKYIR